MSWAGGTCVKCEKCNGGEYREGRGHAACEGLNEARRVCWHICWGVQGLHSCELQRGGRRTNSWIHRDTIPLALNTRTHVSRAQVDFLT